VNLRFDGRGALVVGGGQTPGATIGNGRATAVLLARQGAHVVVADQDLDSAQETVELIRAEGGQASATVVDITVEASVATMVGEAVERLRGIEVVQQNVGSATGDRGATSLDEETWDHLVDLNLKGTWLVGKHTLPHLRERGRGSIVNVSSVAAVSDLNMIAYKSAKAGVHALTRQLALANARFGIRVNAVMPGLIETPVAMNGLTETLGITAAELAARRSAQVPLGHMGDAWDVASASVFLASDAARFITGVVLPVDGGQTCRVG
jgi:NAD(P)-dependent dehydrogenase (short-subunit alcohol dehydrogenase family)